MRRSPLNFSQKLRLFLKRVYYLYHSPYTKDFLPSQYKVGEYSFGKPLVLDWDGKSRLEIGKFCSIAPNVTIFLGGNHRTDWISTYPFPAFDTQWSNIQDVDDFRTTKGDTHIGHDVWIGRGASILSGVTVGNGAVIGAFSVVTKNIPPYTIVAGVPAKEIRKRFTVAQIRMLEKIQWWNWPKRKINQYIHILCSDNLTKLKHLKKP